MIQKVGSHANIVFLKEFVETHKHFYLIMQGTHTHTHTHTHTQELVHLTRLHYRCLYR